MDAMLHLVNTLVRERAAGCARCGNTAGPATHPSFLVMMDLVIKLEEQRKKQDKAIELLRQTIKVRLSSYYTLKFSILI